MRGLARGPAERRHHGGDVVACVDEFEIFHELVR